MVGLIRLDWTGLRYIKVVFFQHWLPQVYIIRLMGELLIKEGTLFHSLLQDKLQVNEERTNEIKLFAGSISRLLQGFSVQLTGSCRNFFRKLKIDEREDENIIFLSKYIIDILNELSKKIHTIRKKIDLDVIDPLNQFSENQESNHRQALLRSEELLYHIQSNNEMLKELNQNYRINEGSGKSSQEKHVLKEIVESEIDKCNHKWQDIKSDYQEIVAQINSYNSLRCHFTMKTQIEIVKLINRLVNSASVDDSLDDYEDMYLENQTLALEIKDEMRLKLGKLIIFQEMDETDIYSLVSSQADEKEKKIIDSFIGIFTSRSNLQEEDKNNEESRILILEEIRWTNYFLNKLRTSLHTEIKLTSAKFRELTSILKYIFALIVEADDNEGVLYNLLYISYRVRCKDQYLIRELGKHDDFWKNMYLWESIFEYIRLTKLKGKINGSEKDRQPHRHLRLKDMVNKAIWSWSINRTLSSKQHQGERLVQETKLYEILCEINYYMVKLELEESFIFDFILSQAVKYNISKQNIKKLLEYHYINRIKTTNQQNATYLTRKQRLEQEFHSFKSLSGKLLLSVGMCLQYLPIGKDVTNVLLVCRDWNQQLRNRVFRRYLIEDNNFTYVKKNRLQIYQAICQPPFSKTVYQRMVQEVPDSTEHLEIIRLDARRSLGWDEKLRVKMIEVLNAFSFYHPDHGYLQGMNYLCENILKLTDDTFICYYIFEHLMNNQFYGMYTGDFDGLKLRIYQFMRMLERELPELFDHLMEEKIEGEHFLLAWTITLWGEMSGELCWVLWDGFLIQGWTWWFKVILWLIKVLEPELMKMNFEEIMKCFSDLHQSLFSYSLDELGEYGIDRKSIKSQVDRIRIQKEVLLEIEKEYRLKSNMIDEYLKRPSQPRTN